MYKFGKQIPQSVEQLQEQVFLDCIQLLES